MNIENRATKLAFKILAYSDVLPNTPYQQCNKNALDTITKSLNIKLRARGLTILEADSLQLSNKQTRGIPIINVVKENIKSATTHPLFLQLKTNLPPDVSRQELDKAIYALKTVRKKN